MIFVRTVVGFEHPDPKHDQLRALQRMIHGCSGELTVESNATLQVLYGLQQTTTADEWARRCQMLVWFDYTSVPQPAADVGDAAQQVLARHNPTTGL